MSAEQNFWSRRKAAVAAERDAEAEALQEAPDLAALEGKSDAEILEQLGLVDPHTLSLGDDFSGFMAKSVPEHLRKRALRHLWRSNPVLACVDGLNDYDLDFTNAVTDAPGVATAYQVGKGMLKHVLELAEKAERAEEDVELTTELELEEEIAPEPDMEPDGEPETIALAEAELDAPDEAVDLPPRRMKFAFDEVVT